MSSTLGVVPVGGSSHVVLQQLHGRTLLSHALAAVADCADRAVVLVDPSVRGPVQDALAINVPAVRVVEVDPAFGPPTDLTVADRFILHDARCPLLTAAEIRRVMSAGGDAVLGVRVITDTVKTVTPLTRPPGAPGPALARVTGTLDRAAYRAVSSPLALSPAGVDVLSAEFGPAWWLADFWHLVPALRRLPVELVDVGEAGHRIEDEAALRELASH